MTTATSSRTGTGYVCKGCGAPSPVGIGYAATTPDRDTPADGCPGPHHVPAPPAVDIIGRRLTRTGTPDPAPDGYLPAAVVVTDGCAYAVCHHPGTGMPGSVAYGPGGEEGAAAAATRHTLNLGAWHLHPDHPGVSYAYAYSLDWSRCPR